MAKKFAIFIDTQVDFMLPSAALYVQGAEKIIGDLNNFAHSLTKDEYDGALFTFDTHSELTYPGSEEAKQFPIHCVQHTSGWENVVNFNILKTGVPLYTLEKNVFNMWEEKDIEIVGFEHEDRDFFFENLLARGIDTVVLVGVAADFCVKWAVDGLLERGFKVEIPRHLTAGIVRQIDQVVQDDFYANPNVTIV